MIQDFLDEIVPNVMDIYQIDVYGNSCPFRKHFLKRYCLPKTEEWVPLQIIYNDGIFSVVKKKFIANLESKIYLLIFNLVLEYLVR